MKILSIVCDLNKGGTQRAAQIFAEAYKKLGHDSRILSFYRLGIRYDELKNDFQIWNGISNINIETIKKWSPDVIHIHSHSLEVDDVNRFLDSLPLNKIKLIEQNVFSTPSAWTNKLNYSFQLSKWASWLYQLRGGEQFKSVIIPYPICPEKFVRQDENKINLFKVSHGIPEKAYVIGRIGQNNAGKWSVITINVFNILAKKNDNIYLVLVNPPSNILKAVSRSKYKDRIIHIERIVGDEQLSIAYSVFDVMLHTAEIGESFGYVLVESMLCGTPVVTLSTPWGDNSQCEIVKNGEGGFVAHTQAGLVKALNLYINKDAVYNKAQVRQRIIDNYDYLVVANRALSCLDGAMDSTQVRNKDVIKILKDTIDKTKSFTILLLSMNSLFFRKLTAYQYNFKVLIGTLIRKMMNKVKLNKK